MSEWQPIGTAPIDGTIIEIRSKRYPNPLTMFWSGEHWESRYFGTTGMIRTYWDESTESPDEWRPVAAKGKVIS